MSPRVPLRPIDRPPGLAPLFPIDLPVRPPPLADRGPDLSRLRFRARTNPLGPAVDLLWDLPDPAADPDALRVVVLRRERRFPGRSRRGVVSVPATAADLADGDRVFDPGSLTWDIEETREEVGPDLRVETTRRFTYRGDPRDRVLVASIRRELPPEGGPPRRTTVRVVDRAGLVAGTTYYYTAFVGGRPSLFAGGRPPRYSRLTQASALATASGRHDLFPLLSRADQERDTVPPEPFAVAVAEHGRGQLERFVRVAEAHADMLLGMVDALGEVHDARRADARVLPAMAAMLGWRPREVVDEEGRRNEIAVAAELYRGVGTVASFGEMISRLTGWPAVARDMVRNVLLSWDESRVERLQAGQAYLDGEVRAQGDPPVLVTRPVPRGSVDTADAVAMQRLRDRDPRDATAHTYDVGRADGSGGPVPDDTTWYARDTLGVHLQPPPGVDRAAVAAAWGWVRQMLAEFLPIQVRTVLIAPPGP
jgi:phage tail-like protein